MTHDWKSKNIHKIFSQARERIGRIIHLSLMAKLLMIHGEIFSMQIWAYIPTYDGKALSFLLHVGIFTKSLIYVVAIISTSNVRKVLQIAKINERFYGYYGPVNFTIVLFWRDCDLKQNKKLPYFCHLILNWNHVQ